jgi:hypothetical protein
LDDPDDLILQHSLKLSPIFFKKFLKRPEFSNDTDCEPDFKDTKCIENNEDPCLPAGRCVIFL